MRQWVKSCILASFMLSGTASAVSANFIGPNGDAYLVGSLLTPTGPRKGAFVAHLNSDGSVDTSYGTNGVARADYLTTYLASYIPEFALRNNGKIVVSGTNCPASPASCTHYLTELDATGQLETNFGAAATPGFVVLAQNAPLPSARILHQQAQFVTFEAVNTASTYDMARYTQKGLLDTTFGTAGHVTNPAGATVLVQRDGKILLSQGNGAAGGNTITRLLPDGGSDPSFLAGAQLAFNSTTAAVEQGNGKLTFLALFGQPTLGTNPSLTLGRLNSDGTVDTNFGTGGVASLPGTDLDTGVEVAQQSTGSFVAFGYRTATAGTKALVLTRFTQHGQLDTTFGTAGEATVAFTAAPEYFTGLHMNVLPDDKIIAYGTVRVNTPTQRYVFAAARFLADGTLDTTYGNMGTVLLDPLP